MQWSIEYFVSENGKSPVKDFIDALSPESKAKFIFIADLLTEYGLNVREPYVKPITGSRKLFEISNKGPAEHSPNILFCLHRAEAGPPAWVHEEDRQDSLAGD